MINPLITFHSSPFRAEIDLLFLSSKKKIGKKMPGLLKNKIKSHHHENCESTGSFCQYGQSPHLPKTTRTWTPFSRSDMSRLYLPRYTFSLEGGFYLFFKGQEVAKTTRIETISYFGIQDMGPVHLCASWQRLL